MRFFFHVKTDGQTAEDIEGQDLPSMAAARNEAIVVARELVAMRLMSNDAVDWDGCIMIAFEDRPAQTISFMEAVGISLPTGQWSGK